MSLVFSPLFSGMYTVGGSGNIRLEKNDYDFAKAATKPLAMALRLVDKLFSPEVLLRSTVHGNKEFAPLDPKVVTAIKGKLRELLVLQRTIFLSKQNHCNPTILSNFIQAFYNKEGFSECSTVILH